MHRKKRRTDRGRPGLIRRCHKASVFHPAAKPPEEHRQMSKMIRHTNNRMRWDPTRNTKNHAVHFPFFQQPNCTVCVFIFFVINYDAGVVHPGILQPRKRLQRIVMLPLQPIKRRIYLSEANKSNLSRHFALTS
ncbi:hypothetical protein SDC9_114287 [bioreactor metagenome]|uniref:Uncharacterized protein n=1 Tax=bioreactor metagenome TaxID=1076179 RepID=A0A645BQ06_9ZZZZ